MTVASRSAGLARAKGASVGREKSPRRDVHISIAYKGSTPGPLLISKSEALESGLAADNAGTAVRKVSGDGAIDLTIVTADPERAREIAWGHVNALGLGSRTTIHVKVVPLRRGA